MPLMQSDTLMLMLFAGLGAAIGGMIRFATTRIIDSSEFPWATFAVNILACFMAAFIMMRFGGSMGEGARVFLVVGIMGGLSTLSTFTTETVNLLYSGSYGMMVLNIVLNVGVCILGAVLGRELAMLL